MSRKPERLDLDGCAKLLGMSRRQILRQIKDGGFAAPAGNDSPGHPYWYREGIYVWAAQSMPHLANRIPVDHWPAPASPAVYLGARAVGDSATALGWQAPLGGVWLVWSHAGGIDIASRKDIQAQAAGVAPDAASIIAVGGDFGFDGPALWAVLPGAPGEEEYEIPWSGLSRILGQPVPYWPFTLRIPGLLTGWQPGSTTAVAAAVPDLDTSPELRLAAIMDQGSPAQQVLLNLAQTWHCRAATVARQDLEIVSRTAKPGTTVIAATPVQVPEAHLSDLPESVTRAGWLEILSRRDDLAAGCVRQKMLWDHGDGFPASNPETIDPDSLHGREWAQRLIPAPRTAAIEVLDSRRIATAVFADPETDAAVIRDQHGKLHAAIPQRLPATSPLAELILDHPIWVRTQDGTLYPAPKDHYCGLSWGYNGTGPGALAVLAGRLLSDINAVAASSADAAPAGLWRLMQERWPPGTILTRAQLEAAHDEQPDIGHDD